MLFGRARIDQDQKGRLPAGSACRKTWNPVPIALPRLFGNRPVARKNADRSRQTGISFPAVQVWRYNGLTDWFRPDGMTKNGRFDCSAKLAMKRHRKSDAFVKKSKCFYKIRRNLKVGPLSSVRHKRKILPPEKMNTFVAAACPPRNGL